MSELERQCLSLPLPERERLTEVLLKSIDCGEVRKTFRQLHEAVNKVLKCEVITTDRRRRTVTGRTILAYLCIQQGMTEGLTGRLIRRDRTSVNRMKKMMEGWLTMPNAFREENEWYLQILKELNDENDR